MKTFQIKDNDISDGYHTFGELYDHRIALFLKLCRMHRGGCFWRQDAETPDWVIVYCYLDSPVDDEQISYHIPAKYVTAFEYWGIKHDPDHKWDGHNSADVVERLMR